MGLGTFAAGLAGGTIAGADTAAKIAALGDERQWRERSALRQASEAADKMDLERQKIQSDREYKDAMVKIYQDRETNDTAKDAAANEIAKGTLGVHQRQVAVAEKNAATDAAYKDANLAIDRTKNDLERSKAEWDHKMKEQTAAGQRLQADAQVLKTTGQVPDGMVDNFHKALGYHPSVLAGPEGFAALDTFHKLQNGQVDLNDDKVHEAARVMFPEIFKRGLHEQPTPDGKPVDGEITKKDLADILVGQDGKLAFTMRVHYKDQAGKEQTYLAPLTEYGSSHQDDQVMLIDPQFFTEKAAEMSLGMEVLRRNPKLLEAVAGSLQKGGKSGGAAGGNISIQKGFDAKRGQDVIYGVDKSTLTKQEIPTVDGGGPGGEVAPTPAPAPAAKPAIDPKKLDNARALWGGGL